jgi:hypothetical protein
VAAESSARGEVSNDCQACAAVRGAAAAEGLSHVCAIDGNGHLRHLRRSTGAFCSSAPSLFMQDAQSALVQDVWKAGRTPTP